MERNEFADDYIDRVVRRSEKDMIIKMKLALLAAVVPALMSAVVGTAVYSTNMDLFVGDSMMVGMIVGISVECSILSFILYTFARRSYNPPGATADAWLPCQDTPVPRGATSAGWTRSVTG